MKKVFIGCSNDENEMNMYADALQFLGYKPVVPPTLKTEDGLAIIIEKRKERLRLLVDCDALFVCDETDDDDFNREVSIVLSTSMEIISKNSMFTDLAEVVLKSGMLKQKPIIGSIEF